MLGLFTFRKQFEHCTRNYLSGFTKSLSYKAAAAKTSTDRRFMIIDVSKSDDSKKWQQLKYPLIWLRDNCQCSSCFDAPTMSRTIDWTEFKLKNAHPKSISVSKS